MPGMTLGEAKEHVGKGWHPLLERIYTILPDTADVCQVKEKFGALRFYVCGVPSSTLEAINAICDESEKICEYCGHPGVIRGKSWLKCTCDKCYQERE